jgi:hypothetical protein
MMKRDLKADLKFCDRATPGQWRCEWNPDYSEIYAPGVDTPSPLIIVMGHDPHDADFIVQAREGWPHAIERALKAEALARELMYALEQHKKWENAFISGAFESFGVAYEAYETTRKIRTEILAKARRLLGDMDA